MVERLRWVAMLAETAGPDDAGRPQRICELCADQLGVSGAGMSAVTRIGNRGLVCSTDEAAAQIEDLQFTLGEGPCIDAVQSGAPVLVADVSEPEVDRARWPAFLPAAEAVGARAVFAFPLLIGAVSVGSIDLYRSTPGELSATQLTAALLAADAAALAVLHAATGAESLADGTSPLSSYEMRVHQATGMVQVQLGVNTEAALLSLRARAFATGQPLLELASDVVNRRVRFSTEDR